MSLPLSAARRPPPAGLPPSLPKSYALVISEKPDAARRIAEALAEGPVSSVGVEGVTVLTFSRRGEPYVVCAAQGHLYEVSDTIQERSVYPVFDVEWFEGDTVAKGRAYAGRRISAVRRLAAGASRVVNACDYDIEGEVIGFNLLRYACGGAAGAARAKFSTLAKEDIAEAFDATEAQGERLAAAGRIRHVIDFAWGVNLSRVLSQSPLVLGNRFRTVSMGRVQGPTLGFVVRREREIRTFVSRPFWRVNVEFEKDGRLLRATYCEERVPTRPEAEGVRADCEGAEGVVESARTTAVVLQAPPAFNLGDLQREAFAAFGYTPQRTLQVAEKLYLDALISYPRTDSQRLPPSIGYARIMRDLARAQGLRATAQKLLRGPLRPSQGRGQDAAHPAIYPTGESPRRRLDQSGANVYDLVARRFLAAFGPPARREEFRAEISVQGHRFCLGAQRTAFEGWMRHYGRYARLRDDEAPGIAEGESLRVASATCAEKFEPRPPRYTQSGLLQRMEREGIGTKGTRAETISTLVSRGYVVGEPLAATELGLSVLELMERYAPEVVSEELTRSIEGRLERIESGEEDGRGLLRDTVNAISEAVTALRVSEADVGRDIARAALPPASPASVALGACPVCRSGTLRVVRSRKTRKRFVGCSNYSKGCKASAPLPQRGAIRPTEKPCATCSWPVVVVVYGRRPWRMCVNMECPSRRDKKDEVPAV